MFEEQISFPLSTKEPMGYGESSISFFRGWRACVWASEHFPARYYE